MEILTSTVITSTGTLHQQGYYINWDITSMVITSLHITSTDITSTGTLHRQGHYINRDITSTGRFQLLVHYIDGQYIKAHYIYTYLINHKMTYTHKGKHSKFSILCRTKSSKKLKNPVDCFSRKNQRNYFSSLLVYSSSHQQDRCRGSFISITFEKIRWNSLENRLLLLLYSKTFSNVL